MYISIGLNYHSDELSTEDKITLYTVEGYLDFKVQETVLTENSLILRLLKEPPLAHVLYNCMIIYTLVYTPYHSRLVKYGMKLQES